jgi:hypothetical protein
MEVDALVAVQCEDGWFRLVRKTWAPVCLARVASSAVLHAYNDARREKTATGGICEAGRSSAASEHTLLTAVSRLPSATAVDDSRVIFGSLSYKPNSMFVLFWSGHTGPSYDEN